MHVLNFQSRCYLLGLPHGIVYSLLLLFGPVVALQASSGASVPWITYEAEDMTNSGGTFIGPPAPVADINASVSNTVEMEASGGKAVKLTATGQYMEFGDYRSVSLVLER